MISIWELIDTVTWGTIPEDHRMNLTHLHYRLNLMRSFSKQSFVVTSGYRTKEKHFSIYSKKNEERIKAGLAPLKIPMESLHLIGAAVDIADPNGSLKADVKTRNLLERFDLFSEHWDATPNWWHVQLYAPASGLRWYMP